MHDMCASTCTKYILCALCALCALYALCGWYALYALCEANVCVFICFNGCCSCAARRVAEIHADNCVCLCFDMWIPAVLQMRSCLHVCFGSPVCVCVCVCVCVVFV